MSGFALFQCVVKDGKTLLRPYPVATTQEEAFYDYAKAIVEFPDLEPVIIFGESVAHLERIIAQYKTGYTINWVKPNEQGLRLALEFQPLRAEYPVGRSRSILDVGLHQDELRALIRLMKRVTEGELGGEHDGDD